ncbi:PREDICTED: 2-hydroxyacylsphingosine 1-beta-galactosyltransferase-like isoform X2 [Amphimedon queenslandica]|uniref:UDP-glucuronosyltransferase n=1 Tax=Amphimedon queenslandica TaxID=400682 RepID=A0AAN0IUQ8_AMPQE|nr:PREDICTED: 2-hydroxyacylsphingosine 1-beta-galactosyltransferase-like isoform X2 [Amphimedon queenslandica]|eukprot:XP_011409643.1 PREDICTED: 2-hydroxyacylsphingosine 1-beta-galactosyltransferase-like isoform X2 [Amphimedon queenslandica]
MLPIIFLLLFTFPVESLTEKKSLSVVISVPPMSGHVLNMLILGNALREQGHNVTFLLPEYTDYSKGRALCKDAGFPYIPIPVNSSYYEILENANRKGSTLQHMMTVVEEVIFKLHSSMEYFIENNGADFRQWDVVLLSDWFANWFAGNYACDEAMKHLRIVGVAASPVPFTIPLSPSWPFPLVNIYPDMTEDLSFVDRFKLAGTNIVTKPLEGYISSRTISKNQECWDEKYNRYLPLGHAIPLIFTTVIGFEYPKSNLPLVDYVGPFISKKPDPLPSDIQSWLDSKKEKSVVYISMGTVVHTSQKIAQAFYNGIPNDYSVLWSATSEIILDLVKNDDRYLVKSWIPQISALNHPSISLAILHGGAGGVHQALYFGIPMIVIPIGGDQPGNAFKVQYWKLGIHLDHNEITPDDLKQSILKIESGPYRNNAKKMSIIMKNAGGVKRAVELIEFYAAVGYDHLVPAYVKYHWSWIQYHNVDVQALLLAIGALMLYLCFKLIKCMCQCCCCRNAKEKND